MASRAAISFLCASICAALVLLATTTPVQATPAADNPGALYIFPTDSPVTNTHPAWQQLAAISGNNVVWLDSRANDLGYNTDRIFYKDISLPDSTEQALTPERNHQSNPAVSGNLVAWDEIASGVRPQVFYMYIGGPGPFRLSGSSNWQFSPRVSGSRIVYCDKRNGDANPDIYLADLNTGQEQPVSTEPGEQIKPDIDADWVVFVDNRDIVLGKPRVNDIFAKNVVTGELRRLTSDSGSVLQSSELSNVAEGTTTIPNLTWSKQRVYWASWNDYQNRQLSIDYRMSNTGTCPALSATIQASLCNPSTVYIVTQLPSVVGDINPGSNRTVTLKYFVPTTVGSFNTTTYSTCNDDAGRTSWFPGPL